MPRSYGPFGLVVSLAVICLLTAAYFVAALGASALAASAVGSFGRAGASLASLRGLVASGDANRSLPLLFALGVALYGSLAAAIITLAVWRARREWPLLVGWTPWPAHYRSWRFWGLVAAGAAYGVGASVAVSAVYPQADAWARFPHGPSGLFLSYVLVAFAGPVAEELLFRGWIFTHLRSRFSFWPSNLASAALFATAHWERTHLYALAVFPLGLMLGYAREMTGSTKASSVFHGAYNGIALTLNLLGPS
jgi:membrane protease YdiL (CAAX protease family)